MSKKMTIGTLIVLVLVSAIYVTLSGEGVKIRIDNDKSTFYKFNENSRWEAAGREYNRLFKGNTLQYRDTVFTQIQQYTEFNYTTIKRTTMYQMGATIIDIWTFLNNASDIELFPISHKVNILNGKGLFYRYSVDDLKVYPDKRKLDSENRLELGNEMKLEIEDNYRWCWIGYPYGADSVSCQYDVKTDNDVFEFRLYDPPPIFSAYRKEEYLEWTGREVTIDHACSYYTVKNPTDETVFRSEIAHKNKFTTGSRWVSNADVYYKNEYTLKEEIENITYYNVSVRICDNNKTRNCYDEVQTHKNITYHMADVDKVSWDKGLKDINSKGSYEIKICADLEIILGERNIDHQPEFFGYLYKEHDWWNFEIDNKRKLTNNDTYADPIWIGDRVLTLCDSSACWNVNLFNDQEGEYLYFNNGTGTGTVAYSVNETSNSATCLKIVRNDSLIDVTCNPFDRHLLVVFFHNDSVQDGSMNNWAVTLNSEAPLVNSSQRVGTFGHFNAVNTSFDFGDIPEGPDITPCFWIGNDGVDGAYPGGARQTSTDPFISFQMDSNRIQWTPVDADANEFFTRTDAFANNQWVFGCFNTSLTTDDQYAHLNGLFSKSGDDYATKVGMGSYDTTQKHELGRMLGNYPKMFMDEYWLFNVTLSNNEINALYRNQNGSFNYSYLGDIETATTVVMRLNGTDNDQWYELGTTANISVTNTNNICISLNLTGYDNINCSTLNTQYIFDTFARTDKVATVNYTGWEDKGCGLCGWETRTWNPTRVFIQYTTWSSQGNASMRLDPNFGDATVQLNKTMDLTDITNMKFDVSFEDGYSLALKFTVNASLIPDGNCSEEPNNYLWCYDADNFTGKGITGPFSVNQLLDEEIDLSGITGLQNVSFNSKTYNTSGGAMIDNIRFFNNDLDTFQNLTTNNTLDFGSIRHFMNLTADLTGHISGGYIENLTIDTNNNGTYELMFPGTFIDKNFNMNSTKNGSTALNLTYSSAGSQVIEFFLPSNVTIVNAVFNLTGYGADTNFEIENDFDQKTSASNDRLFGNNFDINDFNAAEYPTSQYENIYELDDDYTSYTRTQTTFGTATMMHVFRYSIPQAASRINNITFSWYGTADEGGCPAFAAITWKVWNFETASYDDLTVTGTECQEQAKNFNVTNMTKYVSNSLFQYAAVLGSFNHVPGDVSYIRTNYTNMTINMNISFPENVTVDIGFTGEVNYTFTGELNATSSPFQVNFTAEAQEVIDTFSSFQETLFIAINSEATGIINVGDINLTYNLTNKANVTGVNLTATPQFVSFRADNWGILSIDSIIGDFLGDIDYNVTTNTSSNLMHIRWSNFSDKLPYTWSDEIIFYFANQTSFNATPWGQEDSTPIINITNLVLHNTTYGLKTNESIDSCMSIYVSNTSSKGTTQLSENYTTVYPNLTSGSNFGVWMWVDTLNCTSGLFSMFRRPQSYCDYCIPLW